MAQTSRKNNSKTKGAVLAFASSAVLAGALLGSGNETLLTETLTDTEPGGRIQGGGTSLLLSLRNGEASITNTTPTSSETFIAPTLTSTVSYTKVSDLGYTLTAPDNTECALSSDTTANWLSGNHSKSIDLSTCAGGGVGQYTLKVYDVAQPTVNATTTFKYQTFSLGYSVADQNRDPIVIMNYPEGIEFVTLSAYKSGEQTATLDSFRYYVENNEDRVDEIALPFKLVNATDGVYTVTATAYKNDTTPINGQNATITSGSFAYAR